MLPRATVRGFADEVEKIAFDPLTMAVAGAGAKIMGTNAISRFADKIPPIRRLGQEIAGVGVRTAMQGKPMLSGPMRHALAIGLDPKAVSVYEGAHGVGNMLRQSGAALGNVRQVTQGLMQHPVARQFPNASKFISGVPLQSTGIRKAVDYGFTPVSQVGRDIVGGARNLGQRLVGGARNVFQRGAA